MNAERPVWDRAAGDSVEDSAADSDIAARAARVAECRREREPSYPDLPPTDHQADAAAQAARHLLSLGLVPLVRLPFVRVIWKRDRQLAELLARDQGVLP